VPPSLHATLEDTLAHLPRALSEPFTAHPLGQLLVKQAPLALGEVVTGPGYKIQGSPGRGRWAQTVWAAVFDELETDTAQHGFYLVYLFRGDGRGVYLSLNQGTTAVHAEVGGRRYLEVLRDRSAVAAGLLAVGGLHGLQLGPLDLGGSGTLTRGYEAGNVAARFYPTGAVPDDATLGGELTRFLTLYRHLLETKDSLDEADAPGDVEAHVEADPGDAPPRGGDRDRGARGAVEAAQLRWHLRAERNPRLAREAKRLHGLSCAVCGFNYRERYGALGEGYAEAHHLTPFADLQGRPTTLDPARDFAVVCASCHRMIHRRRPPLSLEEVRDVLQ
jgi:5-methylcytosine-specific restriction protein A